jgi:hypothetical protein
MNFPYKIMVDIFAPLRLRGGKTISIPNILYK